MTTKRNRRGSGHITERMNLPPAVAVAVENGYRAINNDPRVLLETAGGPVGRTAHVIVARLYGFDEQIDHEMRLREAVRDLRVPIPVRAWAVDLPLDRPTVPRSARYVLQSNYASGAVAAELAPQEAHDETFRVQFLCLRYKRMA